MTMPGFMERSQVIASLPSLGLLTLAGCTPDGHTLSYHEVRDLGIEAEVPVTPESISLEMQELSVDLVALSSLTAQIPDAYALADALRAAGILVVLGGLHATALPDEALQHVDAVAQGEGEITWPQIVTDAQAGALKPVYQSAPVEFDLADAPMPAFHLLKPEAYNRLTVQTSRGCPHRCEFCASSILITKKYKQKPVKNVLAELDAIRDIWRRPFIEFADDNGLLNKRWWREILPELKARKIRWFTETDISVGKDPVFLRELADGGCKEVLIGLESPIEQGLQGTELNNDWKLKQFKKSSEAVRTIQSAGIRVNGCFIVGLDGHTPKIFDAVYELAAELGLYDVQITLPTAFPGTPFYERLKADGRLDMPDDWSKRTLFDLHFAPFPMTRDELREGFIALAGRLYADTSTRERRASFRAGARAGSVKR